MFYVGVPGDGCYCREVNSQFGQSLAGGFRVAFAGQANLLLTMVDFTKRLVDQFVRGGSVKPPRANDGGDRRANLADGQVRVFPPAATRG